MSEDGGSEVVMGLIVRLTSVDSAPMPAGGWESMRRAAVSVAAGHGTSPLRAGRVVVPPSTQGTVAVQCLLSLLVKLIGTPNGSGPP